MGEPKTISSFSRRLDTSFPRQTALEPQADFPHGPSGRFFPFAANAFPVVAERLSAKLFAVLSALPLWMVVML
ncbi:MAG TPA: hypothetical protein ENF20_07390 [Candidatus Marinimicrobia bacterium]|nr:hypothetical protein [Candidatus Neomarinimicrobiota bacterium]